MKKIKNFLREIKKDWLDIPRSVRFWNLLVLAFLIGLWVYDTDFLYVALALGSFLALGVLFDSHSTENHLWIFLMPVTWFFIMIGLMGVLLGFIYKHTIDRFNEWLDGEKD